VILTKELVNTMVRRVKRRVGESVSWGWNNMVPQILFFLTTYLILTIKIWDSSQRTGDTIFWVYGITVTAYLFSRFAIAYFYSPKYPEDTTYQPTVSVIVPVKNEEDAIRKTLDYIFSANYPQDKLDVFVINDGSTDNTWEKIQEAMAIYPELKAINWSQNRGKRMAMTEGIRRSKADIVVMIDSDSFIMRDSILKIVQDFRDPQVGAVCGHSEVYNSGTNLLTKMQAVRYYVAFKVLKAAEDIFDSVTCCSGCFSTYRRSDVLKIIDEWSNQTFLKEKCTYGDDRSLTNYLLPFSKIKYNSEALAYTIVPDSWDKYLRQQLRWKKSWIRESIRASRIMYKKHPIQALSFYLGVILPFLAPLIIFRNFIFLPATRHAIPIFYILGIIAMSFLYGAYYLINTKDRLWIYGVAFAFVNMLISIWQLPYAALTLKNTNWGTR
jgi:hyaluronan synthase